jgi:hypothetical protein
VFFWDMFSYQKSVKSFKGSRWYIKREDRMNGLRERGHLINVRSPGGTWTQNWILKTFYIINYYLADWFLHAIMFLLHESLKKAGLICFKQHSPSHFYNVNLAAYTPKTIYVWSQKSNGALTPIVLDQRGRLIAMDFRNMAQISRSSSFFFFWWWLATYCYYSTWKYCSCY